METPAWFIILGAIVLVLYLLGRIIGISWLTCKVPCLSYPKIL